MKIVYIFLMTVGLVVQSFGQISYNEKGEIHEFVRILKSKPSYSFGNDRIQLESLNFSTIYKDEVIEIRLSDKPLNLEEKQIVLKNPYSGSEFPLSFSVIYKDKIISLFEPGKFVCYDFAMKRDLEFEKRLNKMIFKRHWIIENKLVAVSDDKLFVWSDLNSWESFQKANPMESEPKLFEDKRYIAYFQCRGEFGGTIYFYDKQTKEIHVTEATCPNSVIKKDNKYFVLSMLGHMAGYTELISIEDLSVLPRLSALEKLKLDDFRNIGYADTSNYVKKVFGFNEVLAFSGFVREDRILYWINWNDLNFLGEIDNKVISVVDPLCIRSEIYTHNPVTNIYDNGVVLMNFDLYGLGGTKEVSYVLVEKNRITKVNWDHK